MPDIAELMLIPDAAGDTAALAAFPPKLKAGFGDVSKLSDGFAIASVDGAEVTADGTVRIILELKNPIELEFFPKLNPLCVFAGSLLPSSVKPSESGTDGTRELIEFIEVTESVALGAVEVFAIGVKLIKGLLVSIEGDAAGFVSLVEENIVSGESLSAAGCEAVVVRSAVGMINVGTLDGVETVAVAGAEAPNWKLGIAFGAEASTDSDFPAAA